MIRSPIARTGTLKPARTRKCAVKGCANRFQPRNISHKVCGPACSEVFAATERKRLAAKQVKAERQETRERKEALQPRKWHLAKAKKALHAYIRARDEGDACISCDTVLIKLGRPGGDYDAGHFRSVGSAKHLEFDERNIFGQCKHCNDHLKGNQLEYERRLRIKKGDAYVDAIKADNEPRHLTIDDFKLIESTYKTKLKELKRSRQ